MKAALRLIIREIFHLCVKEYMKFGLQFSSLYNPRTQS